VSTPNGAHGAIKAVNFYIGYDSLGQHLACALNVPFITLFTGFVSGMVGISGGSFLVPLMVLFIRVPMKIAVGTSTTLVMVTALSGFLGHLSSGHFDVKLAIPLAIGGIIGAIIGTKLTLKTKPQFLKIIFATTSLIAALIMIYGVFR